MRRAATWISQPRGLSGTPSRGHCSGRGEQRLLDRVLRGGEVAEAPDDGAEHLRRELAQQVLVGSTSHVSAQASTGGALITSRTSIGMFSGTPPWPGAADARRGDRVGALGRLDVDDPVAGEELLGLGERAVGDLGRAVLAGAHDPRLLGRGQPLGADQLAGLLAAPCRSPS